MDKTVTPEAEIQLLSEVIKVITSMSFDDEQSYNKVFEAYQKIPQLPILEIKLPAGTQIFRTRSNKKKDFFTSIDEITYPKPEFVNSFGRMNVPNQSIFYCSENRPTSWMELAESWAEEIGFDQSFHVTISEWIVQEDMYLAMIVNSNPSQRITVYDKVHGAAFDKRIEGMSPIQQQVGRTFFEFISNEFAKQGKKEPSTYIKTSAYSNLVLSYGRCHGLIYPSVPFMGEGFNVVLRTELVDARLVVPKSVLRSKIRTEELETGSHHFIEEEHVFAKKIDHDTGVIEW